MDEMIFNTLSISAVASAITGMMGLPSTHLAEKPLSSLLKAADYRFGREKADRVFMYNPDAIALWLFQKYTHMFEEVLLNTSLAIPLASVMPSVTPVCFATMYTGAFPDKHGITTYTKPVLKTDTVFDVLIRAGRKPAIVSTSGDSISMIFLEREMDYFIYETEGEANEKAFELIEKDKHDLIVLYNGSYDSRMHKVAPEGKEALQALSENVKTFGKISNLIKTNWTSHNCVLAFAPDHGCHEIDAGCGSHGLYMPQDINIMHFYGFYPKKP